MKITSIKNSILLIGLAVLLFSCNTAQHFHRDTINTDGLYGETGTDTTNLGSTPWQNLFTDADLKQLRNCQ